MDQVTLQMLYDRANEIAGGMRFIAAALGAIVVLLTLILWKIA